MVRRSTMVTFREDIRYSEAESRDARQTRIVERALVVGGLGFAVSVAVAGLRAWQAWSRG